MHGQPPRGRILPGLIPGSFRVLARQWWRFIIVQLCCLLALTLLIGALGMLLQQGGSQLLDYLTADPAHLEARLAWAITLTALGVALLSLPFLITGAAAITELSARSATGGRARFWPVLGRGAARFLPVLGALGVAGSAVLVAFVLAPFLTGIGVLGLAAAGIRRFWPRATPAENARPWWWSLRFWGFVAIPYAVAARLAATFALTLPAAVIERSAPFAALRAADHAAAGRRWTIAAAMVPATAVSIGVAIAGAQLGQLVAGETGAALLGLIAQLLAMPLVLIVVTLLYLGSAETGATGVRPGSEPAPPVPGSASSRGTQAPPALARTAAGTVAALLITAAVIPMAPTAAGAVAGTVSYTITSNADSLNAGQLATQGSSCASGGPDCTIRAALQQAQLAAQAGATGAHIGFSAGMTINLEGKLSFAPTGAGVASGAVLDLDGGGQGVVLDGQQLDQILAVSSELWNLRVAGLTMRNGWSQMGGALSAGVNQTVIEGALFEGNTASQSGGAVVGRSVVVAGSTFIGNRATYYTSLVKGGAIQAMQSLVIENSTFSGNGVGDEFSWQFTNNQGGDAYSAGPLNARNSTFVNYVGGSLSSAGGGQVTNSIFTTDSTKGGGACTGSFTGGRNVSRLSDTTCPGTQVPRIEHPVVGGLDRSGAVPVFPLSTAAGNPAFGAGADCPATDALGKSRQSQSCDLGAVEVDGRTSLVLSTHPDADEFGSVALRAKVTSSSGATPTGVVVFTVDGVQQNPVALDAVPGQPGIGTAELQVTGLDRSAPHAISASYQPSGLFLASSDSLSYTVPQIEKRVTLDCIDPVSHTRGACTGADWRIADTGSIDLSAMVDDPGVSGTVYLATDASGQHGITSPVAVAGGNAEFTLRGSDLGRGEHTLYAVYESDDAQHAGVSEPRIVTVLYTPTVTLSMGAGSGVYGDAVAGLATVVVTGPTGAPVPTGTVVVRGAQAALDANGRATLDLSLMSTLLGHQDLQASYGGDEHFGSGVSSTAGFQTHATPTETRIAGSAPADARFGDEVTVTVEVSAQDPSTFDPAGDVTVITGPGSGDSQSFGPVTIDTSHPDRDGTSSVRVTIPAKALAAGDHELVAEFAPNASAGSLASTSGSRTLVLGAARTTTTLSASTPSLRIGQQLTLTAKVEGPDLGNALGQTVTFAGGSQPLGTALTTACPTPADDCAVATISVAAAAIGIGSHELTAAFGSSANYAASGDAISAFTVAKAAPTLRLTAPSTIVFGASDSLGVQLDDDGLPPADGAQVEVLARPESGDGDAVALGTVTVVNGLASLPLDIAGLGLTPGAYTLTASFAGDADFAAASDSVPLTIGAATTKVTWDAWTGSGVPSSTTYGQPFDVTVTVANLSNAARPEGDVVLKWNGFELGRGAVTAAGDAPGAGTRTVTVRAVFGADIPVPTDGWLTAEFVPADGFAAATLSTDDRKKVELTPIPVTVGVQMNAVLGQPLAATATVTAGTGQLGIVPKGWITFTLNKSGAGLQELTPIRVVDGSATLADALAGNPLGPVTVDLAGTWSVRATFTADSTQRQIVATVPGNTDLASMTVGSGSSAVTATAPSTGEVGQTLEVDAAVSGATVPGGLVRVEQLVGSGYIPVSAEVALSNGTARVPVTGLGRGEHQLRVHYLGNGTYNASDSASFTVTVSRASSTVTLSNASLNYPGIVGAKVMYTAKVTSALRRPSGIVTFFRDEVQIGWGQLVDDQVGQGASVSIFRTADTEWSGDIVARFQSSDSDVADGEGRIGHSWIRVPTQLTLNAPPFASIGSSNQFVVTASMDLSQFQMLSPALRPAAPSGPVVIGDGAGSTCTITLVEGGAQSSSGSCNVPFVGIGARSLTASYAGDVSYAPAVTAPRTTTVNKGAPVLELQAPSVWRGLGTVPVSWSVSGPTDGGTVTILRGGTEVCTSPSLLGACDIAIPAYDQSQNAGRLTLRYSGSPLWAAADTAKTGTIDACVPYIDPAPQPAESATVAVAPQATTCGSGESAGYYVSDRVIFSARAADGYHITGFVGAPWGRYRITDSYPAADITFGQNGTSASIITSPKVVVADGELVPFTASPVSAAECVLVDVEVAGLPTRKAALNSVYWDTNGKCTEAPRAKNDSTWQVPVEVGSKIKMSYQTGFMPERTKFYGWEGRFEGGAFDRQVSYTVTASMRRITAVFGPICYSGTANLAQPGDGTMEMKLAAPNCTDPQTKERGWTFGSVGTISLTDASGDKLQTISRKYVSQGGSMRWVEESGWVAQKPVYFDKWNGDTGRITPVSTTTAADADGVRRTTRTVAFKVQDRSFTVGADYGRCTTLSSEVRGDPSEGSPGTVTMNTEGNCPLGTGFNGERWYRSGTQVSLTAAPAGKKLKLLGWSGVPVKNKLDATISFPLNDDVKAAASFGTNQNCRPLTVTTVPAGSLKLDTTFSLGKNACEGSYGPKFYDQGSSGNGILINAEPATADAAGAEIVFAWTTNTPGTTDTNSKIWQRTSQLNEEIYGSTTILAYACEFVDISAVVASPDGRVISGAGATNLVRGSTLDGFVKTQPANCATGSDPKSGYAGYAWTVGTELTPLQVADPVAYRFTGWSGDVSGKGESPDTALRLVGPGRTAAGENSHYKVRANFQAICYTLSLPSDADKLEVVTAPNCPGMDAAKRMYLGGTSVVVHAADKGDTLFRNWVSQMDQVDADPHWAAVTMTSDKTVVPYYSARSVGEQITKYGTEIGEGMAIGAKKMVGIASAAVVAYAKTVFSKVTLVAAGIGYAAQGLEYLGVHGAGIDAMKQGAAIVDSMINMLFAPLDCITAWSAGGENTAVFAAQNFLGNAIVTALSAGAAQSQAGGGSSNSTLAALKAQAAAAKQSAQPAVQAGQAISAAKAVYEAASSGNVGIESSAYEAFASQASLNVFSGCLTNRADGIMNSIPGLGR